MEKPRFQLTRLQSFKCSGKTWFGPPRRVRAWQAILSWATSFVGIALLGIVHQYALNEDNYPSLYGSMGATVVLVHATPDSPLAQPRNVIVGHILASIIGVSCFKISDAIAQDPDNLLWYDLHNNFKIKSLSSKIQSSGLQEHWPHHWPSW